MLKYKLEIFLIHLKVALIKRLLQCFIMYMEIGASEYALEPRCRHLVVAIYL